MYLLKNKPQTEMTANPSKYPQGYFKNKPCRECGAIFSPMAPSHLTCSQKCADRMIQTRYLMRNYGIKLSDYERMLESQKNLCAICGGTGFRMAEHHKLYLVVDHCHTTGKVRGLLCHNCNRALGLLKDSKETLGNAIQYLEGAETIRKEYTSSEVEAPSPQK